ncbi:midnolin-like [Parambassis ranga]|uniref:Midnolin-like n=1 Tax=Parambassis ranga TaxID=210632 RepID=A0A6P7K7N7_9TELE|nr:midnolin-like [Parambassis ranga]
MEPQQQPGVCSFSHSAACGAGLSTGQSSMRLSITSTTGSPVELTVPGGETVEGLRTRVSQKLRLQSHRISLLHKNRHLTAGKLLELGVTDGSKLTLVPVIEAGLVCSTARAERPVMDVLESLTEVQINDFLSGRSPLTINLGIGANMMYVQLQLSAQDVKKLQQDRDLRTPELQSGLPTSGISSPPDFTSAHFSTNTTRSTTSPSCPMSSAALDSPQSTLSTQLSPQTPRASHTSHPATSSLFQSHSAHTPLCASSPPSLLSACPQPISPKQATTPVFSSGPTGSMAGPPSPAPASTFTESCVNGSSAAGLSKQPGAVIESLVNHSPGIISGTFSGTLAPCSQSSFSHPRRGIAIILHILNDLLRAASHHQGAPPASELLTAEGSRPTLTQKTERLSEAPDNDTLQPLHSSTEENQMLHCKLEHLQLLMHQRRLQRRTRRISHLSRASHPYQHCHHHP